jgi:simple sugar transport system substrate-binding protein
MTKFAFWLAWLLGLAFPFTTFAQIKPRIIVVSHGAASSPFWLVVKKGAEEAGIATNAEVEYRAPEVFDLPAMARLIDEAVASKPDGLVVSIPDVNIVGDAIRRAVKAGIPVISINSGADSSKGLGCLMHVGQPESVAGRESGVRMKALGAKRVVLLDHEVGNSGLDERAKGFTKGFEGPFHQVETLDVHADFEQCKDAIVDYLFKNKDVDAIMVLGSDIAEPAMAALGALGHLGLTRLGTFDLSPAVLGALINRQMDFAVDQHQWLQGYLPVLFLANNARYGSIPQNNYIPTGPTFVTADDAEQVLDLQKKGLR